ncbi:unnamed protein product, partial [Mesorhabditis belari]|uniref:Strumpellin n=1 Tax=Mesorhabditis belari TaxID=2138241 RepID=A0AAF3J5X1_9BILA
MTESKSWRGVYEDFLWSLYEDSHSIIAEITHLCDEIPAPLRDPSKSCFKSILIDFTYFEKSEQFELGFRAKKDLDDLFYKEHEDFLGRFEKLLNAIANFIHGFQEYCEQRGGDEGGGWASGEIDLARELEIEILSLSAQMLILLERKLPGKLAEYLFIAIYRISDDRTNVEFLVDFLRSRGLNDSLFKRVKLNNAFVRDVIRVFDSGFQQAIPGQAIRLRSCATQLLCGCLFFAPNILNDASLMRKLVDNYFRDQWVLSLGMGIVVNLFEEWQPYKAAINALSNGVDLIKARGLAEERLKRLRATEFPQGTIGAEKLRPCIALINQYNNDLRWLVLHSADQSLSKKSTSYLAAVQSATQFQLKSLRATLRIANFEIEFFKTYNEYLGEKEASISRLTEATCEMITEIAAVFNQGFVSLKVEKKTKLHDWLLMMRKTLKESTPKTPKEGADLAMSVKRRIVQVGEMLDLGGNLAMAQYLEKIGQQLDALAAAHSVSADDLRRAEISACSAYAWTIVDSWAPQVEKLLIESSNSAPVRALFYKLSLAVQNLFAELHTPDRKRLITAAYSYQLEKRLRRIVQSVPRHLFVLLKGKVAPLLETNWPPQILKEQAKEMADFESNFKLAEATSTISNMSVGISRMALTKVGTLEVRPRELLLEGIRAELRLRLPEVMNCKENNLKTFLDSLTKTLHSLHSSFLYLCEHIDVAGHEMWRQELANCLERQGEDEVGLLISQEASKGKNGLQTAWSPATALGHLAQMLFNASSPSLTRYSETEMSWREIKTNRETLTSNETNAIETWVPSVAIDCVDRLLCRLLEGILKHVTITITTLLSGTQNLILDEAFFKSKSFDSLQRSLANQTQLHNEIAKIGNCVLIRTLLNQSRREASRLRAPALTSALKAANQCALISLDSIPESTIDFLYELLSENASNTPELTKFPNLKAHSQMGLLLFVIIVALSPKFANSSICTPSTLMGIKAISHQFNLHTEILSIAQLYHDTNRASTNGGKISSNLKILTIVARTLA